MKFFKYLLSFFSKPNTSTKVRYRICPRQEVVNYSKIWSIFGLFLLLCFSMNVNAASVKWSANNIGSANPDNSINYSIPLNNGVGYALIGDAVFKTEALDAAVNKNFSNFLANNTTASLGGSSIQNGKISSTTINIGKMYDNKKVSVFLIIFDNTSLNNYSHVLVADSLSVKIAKNKTTVISFNMCHNSSGYVNAVPEPNISLLLLSGVILLFLSRPKLAIKDFK